MEKSKGSFMALTEEICQREGEGAALDPGKAQTVVCRLYGISRVLQSVKGIIVLVHGPKGCANYLQGEALCIDRKLGPFLSTDVRESDIILDTEDVLRRSIREAADTYKPDLLVVLTTCSTDIIAEDTSRVIEEMRDEVACKLVHRSGAGFEAAYDQGYYNGYEILIDEIMEKPTKRKQGYVNLLSDLRPAGGGSDALELRRLMEGIGLTFNCDLVSGATIEQIRTSQQAELNITRCNPSGLRACKLIEARFGTPYLSQANPVSIGMTKNWVMELARFFGKEEEAKKFIEREVAELNPIIDKVKQTTKGKKVAIASGPGKLAGLTRLAVELGMEPTYLWCHTYIKATDDFIREIIDQYGISPKLAWEYTSKYCMREILPTVDCDLYIGSDVEKGYLYQRGIPVKCIMAYAMPLYGFKGVKKFALELEAMFDSPMRELASRVCQEEYKKWRKVKA